MGGMGGRGAGGPSLSWGAQPELLFPSAERTWRGVQIPLPEGINFVREVVTNNAVSSFCALCDWIPGFSFINCHLSL